MRTSLCLVFLFAAGCDSYHYHSGRFSDVRHRPFAALDHYEKFLKDRPDDPRAAEVHVRAGELYSGLHRCLEARRHFEAAARGFPKLEPWAARAKGGIMGCPDYFPLESGRVWVYGDSASRGKNMRLDAEVRLSSGGAGGTILTALYAGAKQIRVERAEYKKADWMVLQRAEGDWVPILRYPFKKGEAWNALRGGDPLAYRIEDDDAKVKTVAGTFTNCLKVREFNRKFKGSWKYDYYAPFVGKVATTVAGPGFENPNTELVKFSQ
ncbi:MAG: hypothetical protein HY077_09835 [Elusimicrobia bacterium]|nr:hypothetical protein [Elusimicrobiota bacterium]